MPQEFLQVVTTCKSLPDNDWRSFLQWADTEEMIVYEIRGYGDTPCEAVTDAYDKFIKDPELHSTDSWAWV